MTPIVNKFLPYMHVACMLACSCCFQEAEGQGQHPLSARSRSMGNISVLLQDVFSVYGNAGGLAAVEQLSVGCLYENCLMLPETGLGGVAAGLPVRAGTIGMKCSFYGYAGYSESLAGAAFAKKLGRFLLAGIELTYVNIRQYADYGIFYAVVPGIGIQFAHGDLVTALQWYNPARQHFIGCSPVKALSFFRAGAGFHLGDGFFAGFEAGKSPDEDPEYSLGIEWEMASMLALRTGVHFGQFAEPAFGAGIRRHNMNMDLAVKRHPVLGYSLFLSLGWARLQKR